MIAPGPAIKGIPIGENAISLLDSASSDSLGVDLVRETLASNMLIPILKNSIPPAILKA